MRKKLPREREEAGFGRSSNIVEYKYANYDIQNTEEDYLKTVDELAAAQNALDQVNSTVEFDVEL